MTSHHYHFLIVRTFKIYSRSSFQVSHNTALLTTLPCCKSGLQNLLPCSCRCASLTSTSLSLTPQSLRVTLLLVILSKDGNEHVWSDIIFWKIRWKWKLLEESSRKFSHDHILSLIPTWNADETFVIKQLLCNHEVTRWRIVSHIPKMTEWKFWHHHVPDHILKPAFNALQFSLYEKNQH